MTRGQMFSVLRRRINEQTPDYWTDEDLYGLLNEGLVQVQKRVMKIDPEAFITIMRVPSEANEHFVPKPQGIFYEIEFGAKNDNGIYIPLDKRNFHLARASSVLRAQGLGDTPTNPTYSPVGRFFYVDPAPTVSEDAHFQSIFVPTLAMSADEEVPDIPSSLHFAVVLIAQRMAVGETGDPDNKIVDEIKDHLDDLPTYYRKSGGKGDTLRVDASALGK